MKKITLNLEIPSFFKGTISIDQMGLDDQNPFLIYNFHSGASVLKIYEYMTMGEGCKGFRPVNISRCDKQGKEIEFFKLYLPMGNRTNTETFNLFLEKISNMDMIDKLNYIKDLNKRIDEGEKITFESEFIE